MTQWRAEAREQARALFVDVFGFKCPWCSERFTTPQGIRQHRMRTRRCRIYRKSKVQRVSPAATEQRQRR